MVAIIFLSTVGEDIEMDDVTKTGFNKAATIADVDSTKEDLDDGMETDNDMKTSSMPQQEIKVHLFNNNNSVVSVKKLKNCRKLLLVHPKCDLLFGARVT